MRKLIALSLALLCAVSQAADAQQYILPQPYAANNKGGGTITLGGAAQQVFGTNLGRRGLCIGNPSSETENLYYDLGRNATTTNPKSFELTPGNLNCVSLPAGTWTGTVTVNAATTGHGFIAYEFN